MKCTDLCLLAVILDCLCPVECTLSPAPWRGWVRVKCMPQPLVKAKASSRSPVDHTMERLPRCSRCGRSCWRAARSCSRAAPPGQRHPGRAARSPTTGCARRPPALGLLIGRFARMIRDQGQPYICHNSVQEYSTTRRLNPRKTYKCLIVRAGGHLRAPAALPA